MKKAFYIALVCCLPMMACNKPPEACIEVTQQTVSVGTPVTFTTCSKRALSYHWTMAGPVGAAENAYAWSEVQFNNTFETPGSYTVSLTAYKKYSLLGEFNTTEIIITVQ